MVKKKKRSTNAAYVQAARERAVAAGLCVTCCHRKPVRGHAKCRQCADAASEAISDLRATATTRGVCVECLSRPPVARLWHGNPVTRCQVCLDRAVERRKRWAKAHRK